MSKLTWNPSTNKLHNLLARVDVVTAALHRFHQLSFQLTRWDDSDRTMWTKMIADWQAIGLAPQIWNQEDITPRNTILQMIAEIITSFPNINQQLLAEFGTFCFRAVMIGVPARYPKAECFSRDAATEDRMIKNFEEQSGAIQLVLRCREQVVLECAKLGVAIPAEVNRRHSHYCSALGNSEGLSNQELMTWFNDIVDQNTFHQKPVVQTIPEPNDPPEMLELEKLWVTHQEEMKLIGKRARREGDSPTFPGYLKSLGKGSLTLGQKLFEFNTWINKKHAANRKKRERSKSV